MRATAIAFTAVFVLALAVFSAWVHSLGPAPLGESMQFSTLVVDREGRLLRAFATQDGRWRLPARVTDVDLRYLELLLGYEDRRFRTHRGVDPLATLRAREDCGSSAPIAWACSTRSTA